MFFPWYTPPEPEPVPTPATVKAPEEHRWTCAGLCGRSVITDGRWTMPTGWKTGTKIVKIAGGRMEVSVPYCSRCAEEKGIR